MKMKPSIISTIFFLITCGLSAQNELPSGKIEVIKDFEVRLAEAKKIRIIPQPLVIDSTGRRYEYKLLAPSPAIQYDVPELKPLAIDPEQKPTYYPLFAKAGYGSPNSLLGAVSYDHQMSSGLMWGLDLRHLSANNKKLPLQKFSDTQGRINFSSRPHNVSESSGYLDGHYETVYFYAEDDIPSNPDALKRSYARYDLNVQASNAPAEEASFKYNTFLRYLFDKDDLGTRENSFALGSDIHTLIGENDNPLGLKLTSDLTKMKDVGERSLNNLLVEPYFKLHTGKLKVRAGGIALQNSKIEILPALEVSYNLLPLVTLRVGWQGDVVKNNFHNLSTHNPYIVTRLDSINNMVSREIYGGINGVSGIFNYEVKGVYTKFRNMVFFLQDIDEEEQFKPVFDNGSFIGIEGSLSFGILKHVNIRGNAFTRFYTLDNEEKPWHRPTVGIDAQASYTGGEDIYHLSVLFHAEDGLPYRTVGGTVKNLDPLLDLNLHGDYYFTESLGAFLQINNILGNNSERWAGYPSFGFNAKVGIMLRM